MKIAIVALLAGALSCGTADRNGDAVASTPAEIVTSTTMERRSVTVKFEGLQTSTLVGAKPVFARSDQGQCGVRQDGSRTGFDTSGRLTLKDRNGKILAVSDIPAGTVSDLSLAADGKTLLGMRCTFTIPVSMYEQSVDLTLFEFRWPDTGFSYDDTANRIQGDELVFRYLP